MPKTPSRGDAVSSYIPAFSDGPSGAKVYGDNIKSNTITSAHIKVSGGVKFTNLKYQIFTSTLANSGVVYGFNHNLGKVPVGIFFTKRGTIGQLKAAATSANSVGLADVSAATSAKFFVAGAKNTKFSAFLIL